MIIRRNKAITTHIVPFAVSVALQENIFAVCACGIHGRRVLMNGMELDEHCSQDTALAENETMGRSIFAGRGEYERIRGVILKASDMSVRRAEVHPDIVRKTDEWNALRREGLRPYPSDQHSFIIGGSGFRPRARIAKTVPLSREPLDYVIIPEGDLPRSIACPYSLRDP